MKSSGQSSQLPLTGVKVVEFEGIGPGPLAGFHLVQLGASVTLVARPGRGALPAEMSPPTDSLINRGKHRVTLNLKTPRDKAAAIDLIAQSDALIEGNRPGVMERLGLGPQDCAKMNPRLVYARMTGWGQDGPLATAAGHDINYIALSGALHSYGRKGEKPTFPVNAVGDFGGGGGHGGEHLYRQRAQFHGEGRGRGERREDAELLRLHAVVGGVPDPVLRAGHFRLLPIAASAASRAAFAASAAAFSSASTLPPGADLAAAFCHCAMPSEARTGSLDIGVSLPSLRGLAGTARLSHNSKLNYIFTAFAFTQLSPWPPRARSPSRPPRRVPAAWASGTRAAMRAARS